MNDYKGITDDLRGNRIRNTARTTLFSLIYTITVAVVPFFIRTAMIYMMGDEYTGLGGFFVSVISMLNITELGLSSVIVFFLYEPLAVGDISKAGAYLKLFKQIYYILALMIFILGIILSPFLRFLIKGDIPPDVNLFLSYLLFLISICLSYVMSPETAVITNACQRGDIEKIINIISSASGYVLEFMAILLFRSFLMYCWAVLFQSFIAGVLRFIVKRKGYSFITYDCSLNNTEKKEILRKVTALFGHQLNDKFISSVDNIVLSALMGLITVTLYGNYMFVIMAVMMLLSSFSASLTPSLGNAIVTEDAKSNDMRFKALLWFNGIVTIWSVTCMICIYQPFMKLWMGDRLLDFNTMILFCIYFFVMQIRQSLLTFKNAGGMWLEDRYKPYASLVVNLISDIVLVNIIGIGGALVSSIICISVIEIPWEGSVVYRGYFHKPIREYLVKILSYFILCCFTGAFSYIICGVLIKDFSIVSLFFRAIICTIVTLVLIMLLYGRSSELKVWVESFKTLLVDWGE